MANIDEIVAEHGDLVWRISIHLLSNEQDAQDCYQQTFLDASRLIHKSVDNWQSLLCSIATRRAMDQLRKRYKYRKTFVQSENDPSIESPPDRKIIGEELRENIRQALATLPKPQAEAFWLRHLEQQSPSDIASQLGIEAGNVRVLIHRAIQHLRKVLAPACDYEPSKGESYDKK